MSGVIAFCWLDESHHVDPHDDRQASCGAGKTLSELKIVRSQDVFRSHLVFVSAVKAFKLASVLPK
jgi:hypothetical protein